MFITRYCSSSYSFAESDISLPARSTRLAAVSTVRSPTEIIPVFSPYFLRVMTRKKYGEKTGIISVGDLTVDTAARRVERAGREISLSAKEYELLQYLVMNKGVVLSREKIEDHIWNYDYEGGTNVVDVYIRYLRKKIDEGEDIKLIHTVRGAGYVIK